MTNCRQGEFQVRVPATTANMGPGFDCIGLALSLYLCLDVSCAPIATFDDDQCSIEYPNDPTIPTDESNLILKAYKHLLKSFGYNCGSFVAHRVHITVTQNDIPLSRGLGSSASAIVAGMMICNQVHGFNLTKSNLLDFCLDLEPHPDNIGPCLMGGLFVGFVSAEETSESKCCWFQSIKWNPSIKCLLLIPDLKLSTEECRKVLPLSYSRADVISNLQRVAVLVATLSKYSNDTSLGEDAAGTINPRMIFDLLQDSIHQPYRMKLIPGLEALLTEMKQAELPGYLGTVLSGAGPTILTMTTADDCEPVRNEMTRIFQQNSALQFQIVDLQADNQGASIVSTKIPPS